MPPRSRPRLHALVALAAAASLAVAGCSGDDGGGSAGEPAPTEPGQSMGRVSPLTGLPVKDAPSHPVLAVKIDNSSSSAPQLGLGAADMVAEELVEGGITRLAVFYLSRVPDVVGPVRSMRATDIGVVRPLHAVLVASGGAQPTVERVRDADIRTVTEGAAGYFRDTGRAAPYNLFMRLPQVARSAKADDAPEPYLPFGDDALPQGKRARELTVSFSPRSTSTFAYRKGRYVNTDSYAAAGDQFVADTVLVLRVRIRDAGYLDPSGSFVPETVFTGQGPAQLFHGGRVVSGRWVKDGLDAPVQLEVGGEKVEVPPGKVWLELVPVDGGSVSVRR